MMKRYRRQQWEIGNGDLNSGGLLMSNERFTDKRAEVVRRINAMENELVRAFDKLKARQDARVNDPDDLMIDWEVDATVTALDADGNTLYESSSLAPMFTKDIDQEEMEFIHSNHNDFPYDIPREQLEHHCFIYHDMIDHTKQSKIYGAEKTVEIVTLTLKLTIWDQFEQMGVDIQDAIKVAKANLAAHAATRRVLTNDDAIPEVSIAAFLHENDPDCEPDYAISFEEIDLERHPGVEDPYDGVIKYFGLDYDGAMPPEMAARTRLLYTEIQSSLTVHFPLFD